MKITPGTWEVHHQKDAGIGNRGSHFEVLRPLVNQDGEYKGQVGGYEIIIGETTHPKITEAHARFISEAGTVANQCGLMPSELLAQRDELLDTLKHIEEYWNRNNNERAMEDACWHIIETAQDAIYKVENK